MMLEPEEIPSASRAAEAGTDAQTVAVAGIVVLVLPQMILSRRKVEIDE
jgi:hypothetical protein